MKKINIIAIAILCSMVFTSLPVFALSEIEETNEQKSNWTKAFFEKYGNLKGAEPVDYIMDYPANPTLAITAIPDDWGVTYFDVNTLVMSYKKRYVSDFKIAIKPMTYQTSIENIRSFYQKTYPNMQFEQATVAGYSALKFADTFINYAIPFRNYIIKISYLNTDEEGVAKAAINLMNSLKISDKATPEITILDYYQDKEFGWSIKTTGNWQIDPESTSSGYAFISHRFEPLKRMFFITSAIPEEKKNYSINDWANEMKAEGSQATITIYNDGFALGNGSAIEAQEACTSAAVNLNCKHVLSFLILHKNAFIITLYLSDQENPTNEINEIRQMIRSNLDLSNFSAKQESDSSKEISPIAPSCLTVWGSDIKPGFLVKNKKFAEVFYVDTDLKLNWVVNEQAARKHFGSNWNKEIKEYDDLNAYGLKFGRQINSEPIDSSILILRPGFLVKSKGSKDLYYVNKEMKLQYIPNEQVARKNFGANWNKNIREYEVLGQLCLVEAQPIN